MTATYIAVSVLDANDRPVSGYTITVVDPHSALKVPFRPVKSEISGTGKVYDLIDVHGLSDFQITITHPQYAQRILDITFDPTSGNLSAPVRSLYFGTYTSASSITSDMMASIEVPMLRVRKAVSVRLAVPGPPGSAEGVFDDPHGIWLDPSGLIVGLFDGDISDYPVVLDQMLSKDAGKNNWGRFNSTMKSVTPNAATSGTWFDWLEYGDAGQWLVAIWAIGRAGANPSPNTTDVLVFFSPNTAFSDFAPESLYPYKRKFFRNKASKRLLLEQPYSFLAYRYLSPGGATGDNGKDFGFAYQAMAAGRSLVLIMPIQAYGYWGPIQAQDGLMRLIQEVLLYVGDNSRRAPRPYSTFNQNPRPVLGRVGVFGYSAGMSDVRRLMKTETYRKLADTYAALASQSKDPERKTYAAMAQQLHALQASLWASDETLFFKSCREIYSLDGFFPRRGEKKAFQDQMGDWFTRTDDAMLRIYATDKRFDKNEVIAGTKLDGVFRGVTPTPIGTGTLGSLEFHRGDGRASFAWFTEAFMNFTAVNYMPDMADPGIDAHHTIPRVVLSQALALSHFRRP